MDRQRFEQITAELLERTVKNPKYRRKLELMAARGQELPETYEDCLTWIAKPRMKACEDCPVISTNNLKHITLEEVEDGERRWFKRCDECGKKTVFHPKIKRRY